jgi:predicted aspartyl protease
MKKLILLFTFLLVVLKANAQMVVTANASAISLVNTLLDPSIILVGVPTINCKGPARATFTATGLQSAAIGGITTGIILSTGVATDIAGNNGPTFLGATNIISTNNGGATNDPDLQALIGKPNNDVCSLTFSIQPNFDTLSISYVFGTEEFPTYCPPTDKSGTYNDIFGFFISGPGIAGTKNIATIPGTVINVSSLNINSVTNASFFINNNTVGNPISFNGLTTLLSAKIKVTSGGTYIMKLAIADVGDALFDSGIMIKAASIKAIAVPIELVSFKADKEARKANVKWTTATELNNDYFELQRSIDGSHYETIYTVKGAGTSSILTNYSYIDEKPVDGSQNYYRLMQVDFDGKKKLSKILSVNFLDKIKTVSISPNPIGNKFTAQVNIPAFGIGTIEVMDITGRVVISKLMNFEQGLNSIEVDADQLLTGTYFFRIVSDDFTSDVQRIVK